MNDNNDNFNDLNDTESLALKKKLKGRQQQMTAQEMKQSGNILNIMGGKVEEIKGKLNERSADAALKKISEEKLNTSQETSIVAQQVQTNSDMTTKNLIMDKDAKRIGEQLGIKWNKFDVHQFKMGMKVELEHGTVNPLTNVSNDDLLITGKIALAHLNEFSDYYIRLLKMEKEAKN